MTNVFSMRLDALVSIADANRYTQSYMKLPKHVKEANISQMDVVVGQIVGHTDIVAPLLTPYESLASPLIIGESDQLMVRPTRSRPAPAKASVASLDMISALLTPYESLASPLIEDSAQPMVRPTRSRLARSRPAEPRPAELRPAPPTSMIPITNPLPPRRGPARTSPGPEMAIAGPAMAIAAPPNSNLSPPRPGPARAIVERISVVNEFLQALSGDQKKHTRDLLIGMSNFNILQCLRHVYQRTSPDMKESTSIANVFRSFIGFLGETPAEINSGDLLMKPKGLLVLKIQFPYWIVSEIQQLSSEKYTELLEKIMPSDSRIRSNWQFDYELLKKQMEMMKMLELYPGLFACPNAGEIRELANLLASSQIILDVPANSYNNPLADSQQNTLWARKVIMYFMSAGC